MTDKFIAVDGGGTKTEFLLCRTDGSVLGRCTGGPSNPNHAGAAASMEVLASGIVRLSPDGNIPVYAGIAGTGFGNNRKLLEDMFSSALPECDIRIRSDIENLLNLERDCHIGVICGTGSSAFAEDGDGIHRVGGWGYLFDSAGSAYDLGRDAIAAALAEEDGLCRPTAVGGEVHRIAGGRISDILGTIYSGGRDRIAAFAQAVTAAADNGDPEAISMLDRTAGRLAFLVNHLYTAFSCGSRAVFSGGLVLSSEILRRQLKECVNPELELIFSHKPQIFGACAAFIRYSGAAVTQEFEKNFSDTYRQFIH